MSELLKKFLSRKFLAAAAGIIFGIALAKGCDETSIRAVAGAITSLASVLAYIFTEGRIDREKPDR